MVKDNEIRITESQSANSSTPEAPKTRSIFTDWNEQKNRDLKAKSENEAKSPLGRVRDFVDRIRGK